MLWFTSDLHLGHANILHLGKGRPFDSLEQMETYLIDAINDRVSYTDELWILGDFFMHGTPEKVLPYLERIVCPNVHLVRGNHDAHYTQERHAKGLFKSVSDYAELGKPSRDGYRLVLSHYPMLDWNRMYHASYMLHGHIHSLPDDGAEQVLGPIFSTHEHAVPGYNAWNRANGIRRYDVGVDANDYAPVSIDEIERFFENMSLAVNRQKYTN
ncbi:MAG: metallophosphoesterase [Atopobiaceae bacterium]|nr:metallophosphoesterase [Atopobiaceae bacterium]